MPSSGRIPAWSVRRNARSAGERGTVPPIVWGGIRRDLFDRERERERDRESDEEDLEELELEDDRFLFFFFSFLTFFLDLFFAFFDFFFFGSYIFGI